jgi:hypothetical protein
MAVGLGLSKTENINRMITLSVITLSGFHCIPNQVETLGKDNKNAIEILDSSFKWSPLQNESTLQDIKLKIKKGTLN